MVDEQTERKGSGGVRSTQGDKIACEGGPCSPVKGIKSEEVAVITLREKWLIF